jgi:hypothetical protein
MQHITQIANHLTQRNSETTFQNLSHSHNSDNTQTFSAPPRNFENSLKLWHVMGEIYGLQWFREYGDTPNTSWIIEIERLTLQELARGIEQCKRSHSQFAPRLPQFLGYCDDGLTQEQRAFNERCKEGENLLRLPRPQPSKELRRAAILEMKRLLR